MKIISTIPDINDDIFPQKIKAIFFDMDGTLLNSEVIHAFALFSALTEIEYQTDRTIDDLRSSLAGLCDHDVFSELKVTQLNVTDFIGLKNKHFVKNIKLFDKDDLIHKKMHELLLGAKELGIKLALVTASEETITSSLIEGLNLKNLFDCIITRNDVELTKPHPDPYLKALEVLELACSEVVIFEDSHTGLQSAKKSGATVFHANWY